MSVEVIIVNYRSGNVLPRCLDALQIQTQPCAITVVDNASGDGSARDIHALYPDVSILPLRYNVGFARAVNIAAQRSRHDIIVTLNPDTVPDPSFIEKIADPLRTHPAVASVAGTLVFESRPDIVASAGIRVHQNGVAIDRLLGEHHDAERPEEPVFGASGGAAAYRREAFLATGSFAESFFMYLEDVDLAWRLRLAGHECYWAPGAVVTHRYSASAVEGSTFKRRLLARNRIWTLARCLPDEFWRRDAARILAFDAAAFGYGVATLDGAATRGRLSALAGLLPRLGERRGIQRSRAVSVSELDRWIEPPLSPRRMMALRRLTARLAG